MNISYISGSVFPSKNANSVHVMSMGNAIAEKNKLTVFAYSDKDICVEDLKFDYGSINNFNVVLVKRRKYFSQIYLALSAFRSLGSNDVIYSRNFWPTFLLIPFLKSKKVIFETHSISANTLTNKMIKFFVARAFVVKVVSITQALVDDYEKIGFCTDKFEVHPDACSLPKIVEAKKTTSFDVGYVGHLYPGRGMDVIIECARKLPNVNFHIIGGREEDINYYKERECLDNIKYYGHVSPSELPKYYSLFDIALAPYQRKVQVGKGGDTGRWMSPMKIFEYMAFEKSIISSDIDVLREVIDESVAMLVEPSDSNEWVEAISFLVKNKSKRIELAKAAKSKLEAHYTWEKRASSILSDL